MVDLLSQYETVGLQLNCANYGSPAALSGVLKRVAESGAREGLQNIALMQRCWAVV